ncbi:MAG: SRPBCC domain-containing protein [Patescibacteria group bacterium]|nr:SRPBCC domain-containing protein [Patescibacteria group bacterium]
MATEIKKGGAAREVTITRVMDAPIEKVWRAWTDPKEISKWWGPRGVSNPVCEIDLRVGGSVYIVMLAGKELGPLAGERWPMRGTFREIDSPHRLVFANNAVDEAGNILIEGETTLVLKEEGKKTRLTLTTRAQGRAPQAPQMLDGMKAGWTQSIDKLEELLGGR